MRLATAVLAAGLAACTGPGQPAPDPTQLLREAGQAMAGVRTVSAEVRFGPGVSLQGLTLSSASVKLQLPGESDTVFKVKQGDFLVDVRVITAHGHAYLKLPFSRFTEISEEQAGQVPDLARLLDPRAGLPAVLPAGRDTRRDGSEKVAATDCDRLTTTYAADQVGSLLGGRRPAGDVRATLWVGQSDHLIRRMILSGELVEAGRQADVQVDLHDYNQPVTITPPA